MLVKILLASTYLLGVSLYQPEIKHLENIISKPYKTMI
jgi:hypothetical protein